MCAVLNDPRKDRNKINYLFTKTWGSDFTENVTIPPSVKSSTFKTDFESYKQSIAERHQRHVKNKADKFESVKPETNGTSDFKFNVDLDQIPKIFFDPNFSLGHKETFDKIISFKFLNKMSGAKLGNPFLSEQTHDPNPFLEKKSESIFEADSCTEVLDKLNFYLDITETQISKQISTKANTFFHAMSSQDEVQEHVIKTCTAVKYLRRNLVNLDERVVLKSIQAIKLTHLKLKYKNLLEKYELMSFVYKTQPTIQLHLSSAEFTGALDLIGMSQEILRQDLRGIRSLRHYDSQFTEIEKVSAKI